MSQCQSCTREEDGRKQYCGKKTLSTEERLCPDHATAANQLISSYTKAAKEAEALEILASDMQDRNVEECRNFDEVSTAVAVAETLVERLNRAFMEASMYRNQLSGFCTLSLDQPTVSITEQD